MREYIYRGRDAIPDYIQSDEEFDLWLCTACGAPMIYAKPSGRHAGPSQRGIDRRYAWTACWRVAWLGKPMKDWPHASGATQLFRHDSRPQSVQPVQDARLQDLPSSWKDSSATYGTFPDHRGAARHGGRGAPNRPVVVQLVEPTTGRLVGRLAPVWPEDVVPLNQGAGSGLSKETQATDSSSSRRS